jgi:hypothetical protein
VNSISIRERLAELKNEVEQIRREDRMYKKKGRGRPHKDIVAHDKQMARMRQILAEIARLTRRA